MHVLNYTEFRANLTKNLQRVHDDAETIIVSRGSGKNVVVISLDEYNAIQETLYLQKSQTNNKRIEEAIKEMNKGKFQKHKLAIKK
jgi:antitoxin YefM